MVLGTGNEAGRRFGAGQYDEAMGRVCQAFDQRAWIAFYVITGEAVVSFIIGTKVVLSSMT